MKKPKICIEYFNLKNKTDKIDEEVFQKALELCNIKQVEIDNEFFGKQNTKTICRFKDLEFINFTISFLSQRKIAKINNDYRNKNKPTNVLSFEGYFVEDKILNLGDIYICLDVIKFEALEQEKTFANHYLHIALHGFLHLLKFDHINKSDAKIMEALEIEILKNFGIENPYQ